MTNPDGNAERPWWSLVVISPTLFLWGWLALFGLDRVRSHPSVDVAIYVLIIPLIVVTLGVALSWLAFFRQSARAGSAIFLLLFLFLPYLIFASGGV